jgi:hypothetical protein
MSGDDGKRRGVRLPLIGPSQASKKWKKVATQSKFGAAHMHRNYADAELRAPVKKKEYRVKALEDRRRSEGSRAASLANPLNPLIDARADLAGSRKQATTARAIEALALMNGGTGTKGEPAHFWTGFPQGARDEAESMRRTRGGMALGQTRGGVFFDAVDQGGRRKIKDFSGEAGESYVWNKGSIDLAAQAGAGTTFSAPEELRGEIPAGKVWMKYEKSVLEPRGVAIEYNNFDPVASRERRSVLPSIPSPANKNTGRPR